MDYDDLEEKLKKQDTTMMILCNPHNPVRRVWNREELSEVCRLCARYHETLLADEIHADLIRCGTVFVPSAMVRPGCRMVICTGSNKTFNVAGLQCTNVIIQDEERRSRSAWNYGIWRESGQADLSI